MYYVVYVSFDFEVKVFGQVRWKSDVILQLDNLQIKQN